MCLYSTEFGVISVCAWPGCAVSLMGNVPFVLYVCVGMCLCVSHVETLRCFNIKAVSVDFQKLTFSRVSEIISRVGLTL